MGALYGLAAPRSAAAAGAAFGLAVWAAGYAGWLPLIGIRESTVAGPPAKIPFPLAAHIVFGVTTAAVHEAVAPRLSRTTGRGSR